MFRSHNHGGKIADTMKFYVPGYVEVMTFGFVLSKLKSIEFP